MYNFLCAVKGKEISNSNKITFMNPFLQLSIMKWLRQIGAYTLVDFIYLLEYVGIKMPVVLSNAIYKNFEFECDCIMNNDCVKLKFCMAGSRMLEIVSRDRDTKYYANYRYKWNLCPFFEIVDKVMREKNEIIAAYSYVAKIHMTIFDKKVFIKEENRIITVRLQIEDSGYTFNNMVDFMILNIANVDTIVYELSSDLEEIIMKNKNLQNEKCAKMIKSFLREMPLFLDKDYYKYGTGILIYIDKERIV